ncbi:hypothetical protein EVG20_g11260 [Dentipellis fragilis]|uniref:Uncharacterized protein n=1 Tax=Dentipellis fragilis TaxID=205917 RepID=A0A4Y9XLH5_9AGAM|nr:hypothetical protein EVG20_g11260 [Dentipellis fragilis]
MHCQTLSLWQILIANRKITTPHRIGLYIPVFYCSPAAASIFSTGSRITEQGVGPFRYDCKVGAASTQASTRCPSSSVTASATWAMMVIPAGAAPGIRADCKSRIDRGHEKSDWIVSATIEGAPDSTAE